MTEHKTAGCPFENVHRRLEDAHTQWHGALDGYYDPDQFRVGIQSCIPSLRSVTWLLQNQKREVPDFDNWYGHWQDKMKSDTVMRWLVDARNTIEKQGDLKTYSSFRAQVIASYKEDEVPMLDVSGDLFENLESLFSRLPEELLAKQILKHGVLKIERRWVANTLPTMELLDALAEVYGKLEVILGDAHRQIGLPVPYLVKPHPDLIIPVAGGGPSGGRRPCMVSHDYRRSILMSLKSGERITFASESINVDEAEKQAMDRYGDPRVDFPELGKTMDSIAHVFFLNARKLFLIDGGHSSIVVLFKDSAPIDIFSIKPDTRSDKYLMMRYVASRVEQKNADMVMLIAEAWIAPPDPAKPYLYPAEQPDRLEALYLWACSSNGDHLTLSSEIKRDGELVSLESTIEDRSSYPMLFEPVQAVWRKIGKDWKG